MVGGLLGYLKGLFGVVARTGRMPVLKGLAKAHLKGDMSRREFFRRIGGLGEEAGLQNQYIKSINELEHGKRLGEAILSKNSHILDKINLVNKEVGRREKISLSLRVRNRANYLKNNPKEAKISRYNYASDVSETNTPPKELLREIKSKVSFKELATQELYEARPSSKILNDVRKKFNLTLKERNLISSGKNLKRDGFEYGANPLRGREYSDKYFDSRKKLQDFTGMDHTELVQYINPKYMTDKGPSFPGKDVIPKELPKVVKETKDAVSSAWEEVKKSFYEGLVE